MKNLFGGVEREIVQRKAAESRRRRGDVNALMGRAGLDVGPHAENAIRRKLGMMPLSFRLTYLKAMSGRSLPAAVKLFCLECFSWDKAEIDGCTAPACPLYPYRPYQEAR